MTDVVVTGVGVVSAFGAGTAAFWDGLCAGRSALVPADGGGPRSGVVTGLEARDVVRTAIGRRIDRASLFALAAARGALADAGLDDAEVAGDATGLVLGSALGNLGEIPGFLDRLFDRGAGNPLVFPNMVMNAPLSYASIELGVTGPTACLTEHAGSHVESYDERAPITTLQCLRTAAGA